MKARAVRPGLHERSKRARIGAQDRQHPGSAAKLSEGAPWKLPRGQPERDSAQVAVTAERSVGRSEPSCVTGGAGEQRSQGASPALVVREEVPEGGIIGVALARIEPAVSACPGEMRTIRGGAASGLRSCLPRSHQRRPARIDPTVGSRLRLQAPVLRATVGAGSPSAVEPRRRNRSAISAPDDCEADRSRERRLKPFGDRAELGSAVLETSSVCATATVVTMAIPRAEPT